MCEKMHQNIKIQFSNKLSEFLRKKMNLSKEIEKLDLDESLTILNNTNDVDMSIGNSKLNR
jgi:hypothetical protein